MQAYMGLIFPSALTFPIGGETAYCNGQTLNVQQNTALFSLLGTNFGGNGVQTFALPDLRGRVPIGISPMGGGGPVSPTGLTIPLGQATSNPTTTLTVNNLPTHNHPAVFNVTTGASPINITVGAAGPLQAAVPALTVNGTLTVSTANAGTTAANSVPSATNVPAGTSTKNGVTSLPTYAYGPATAPNTANWTVGGTTATANAPVTGTISGSANMVNGGSVTVGVTGGSQPFSNLPPYLGLAYLIITVGLYPPRD
jgi:microcystin-dependent protein